MDEIFNDIYENCKKEEGTFFFRDYSNAICLKQKPGTGDVIDFSENTEIVGTHFGRKYHSGYLLDDDDKNLLAYSWYECDVTNTRYNRTYAYDGWEMDYNHESCMKNASKFRTVDNPAGLGFIEEIIACENSGNAFYYRNDPNDKTKFEYVCLEEHPLDYYHPDSYNSIPKNCVLKDKQFVCGVSYSFNGKEGSLTRYSYSNYDDPNEFYKLLVNAIYETQSMNRYDLTAIDYESNTITSMTMLSPQRKNSVVTFNKAIKKPENVSKMYMHCYGQYGSDSKKGKQCFPVKGSKNNYECYNFYTEIPDSNSCYVYTQHASPIATSTSRGKCETVATYRTIVGTKLGPNFTTGTYCNSETHVYNPFTYEAVYTTPTVESPEITPTPTPSTCNHGYPCCKKCGTVYYEDSDALWGVENDDWCEYLPSCFKKY
jgi:hypothetical protein